MNPLAWFAGRAAPQNGQALAFAQALAHEAVLPFTVLAVPARGGLDVATFGPRSGDIASWIAKRAARRLYMLTAQASAPLAGRAISESSLLHTRIIAVAIPAGQRRALDAFRPAPSVIVETAKGFAVAWRLHNPATPEKARELAAQIAAHLGGSPLDHLFPLPGIGNVRLLKHLKGPSSWALPTAFDAALGNGAAQETGASEALFVRADAVEMEQIRWLWPGVLPIGALSLIAGEAGVGKSTLAACIAAIVSAGEIWPTGERAKRGGVIFCEGEDPRDTVTAPRLAAAGADMARVILGPVCDLSASVAQLQDVAAKMPGGVKLVTLSPLRSFFGLESYRSGDVRARLAPLLAWAESEGVAILGVSHPKTGQRDFAGASAWKEVARAGLFAERTEDGGRHVTPLKANQGRDDWVLPYRIEEVRANGIETSRVVFSQHPAFAEAPKVAEVPKPRTMSGAAAKAWLADQLADGPKSSAALRAALAANGLDWNAMKPALYRAAASLGALRQPVTGTSTKLWVLEE